MILPFLVRGVVGSLKPPVFPGSNSWGYGSYGVTIPEYNTLTVEIWGAGGGGSNAAQGSYQATDGGTSYFAAPSGTVYAFGGTHGYFDASGEEVLTIPGSHGSASGGDINTVGGGNPGGAGGSWNTFNGAPGGYGGYVRRSWTFGQAGAPVIGSAYTLVCAGGGAGGVYEFNQALNGYPGSNASARLTWS